MVGLLATQVRTPNIMGGYLSGLQTARQNQTADQQMGILQGRLAIEMAKFLQQQQDAQQQAQQVAAQQEQFQQLGQQYAGGDEAALAQMAAMDPQRAGQFRDVVSPESEDRFGKSYQGAAMSAYSRIKTGQGTPEDYAIVEAFNQMAPAPVIGTNPMTGAPIYGQRPELTLEGLKQMPVEERVRVLDQTVEEARQESKEAGQRAYEAVTDYMDQDEEIPFSKADAPADVDEAIAMEREMAQQEPETPQLEGETTTQEPLMVAVERQKARAKKEAEAAANFETEIREAATGNAELAQAARFVVDLYQDEGFEPGFAPSFTQMARQFADRLGLAGPEMQRQIRMFEQIQRIGRGQTQQVLKQFGVNPTDFDVQYSESMQLLPENSKHAILGRASVILGAARRAQEKLDFMDQWISQYGGTDKMDNQGRSFQARLNEEILSKPLVTPEILLETGAPLTEDFIAGYAETIGVTAEEFYDTLPNGALILRVEDGETTEWRKGTGGAGG